MSDPEIEIDVDVGVHAIEDEGVQYARCVSSDKNIWRCPSWEPSQLFVHRERHISHRPLSGTVNSNLHYTFIQISSIVK